MIIWDVLVKEWGTFFMLISRNVRVSGHRTSIRLDPEMWDSIEEIARREDCSVNWICSMIDRWREDSSLTAAIRDFILRYFRMAATERGHLEAGHGAVQQPKGMMPSLTVSSANYGSGAAWLDDIMTRRREAETGASVKRRMRTASN